MTYNNSFAHTLSLVGSICRDCSAEDDDDPGELMLSATEDAVVCSKMPERHSKYNFYSLTSRQQAILETRRRSREAFQ